MLTLEKEGDIRATKVISLIEKKDRLIGALLLGNNLVNIMASAIATAFLIRIFGESGVVYATIIMTLAVLIFSEVLPKTYALINSDKVALIIAPAIKVVVLIFSPMTVLVSKFVNSLLKLLGVDSSHLDTASMANQELRGAIELAHGAQVDGDFKESLEKRAMLRSVLDLVDVTIEDVMTHRSHLFSINIGDDIETIVKQALNSPFTRIPVWQDNQDNFIGILHAKTLIREMHSFNNSQKLDIRKILVAPWYVPETTTLFDQLQAFRQRKEHFAIVIDEYSACQGIVTLEDVLEEIVGDISDEYDEADDELRYSKLDEFNYVFDGKTPINDLCKVLAIADDTFDEVRVEADTIGGLVLAIAGRFVFINEKVVFDNFTFTIESADRRRVKRVKMTINKSL
jgi:Mg2+/Co2+ transporter CorB